MSIWDHKESKVVLFTKRNSSKSLSDDNRFWLEDTGPYTSEFMQKHGWGLIAPATLSRWSS